MRVLSALNTALVTGLRTRLKTSPQSSGVDGVVPLRAEGMKLDVQRGHIVVGHGQAFLVEGLNPIGLNSQAVGGGGATNTIEG